jgi:nucleotide-binding universal stress UspA family protein
MTPVYLVGVDGSNCGERALEYAAERAASNNGKLLVTHVIEWSPYSFSTAAENEQRHKRREEELVRARAQIVDPIVERLRASGLDAESVIRHGHASETLARLAKELDVTCVVIGRRGSTRLKAKIFGSVASNLVQIADRPVTVVP